MAQRRVTTAALLLTALLLVYSTTLRHPITEYLDSDYGITPALFWWVYGVMLVVCGAAFFYEPAVRRELREAGALPLVAGGGLVACVAGMALLGTHQPERFVRPVLPLSFLLLYLTALFGLLVLLALPAPTAAPTRRMGRYAAVVLAVVSVGMVALHLGSVGHFVLLDDIFDEVWAASTMANYATNGDFSPSLGGSPFGTPDPAVTRWFVLNAWWARLRGSTDFFVLREFQMIAGLLMAGVVGAALWRSPGVTRLGVLGGVAALLSMVTFARTAHNLRMDIGFGLYGAVMLLCLLGYFRAAGRGAFAWLAAAGAALYLALETIPTMGLVYGVGVGLVIVGRSIRRPLRETQWAPVAVYAGVSALACWLYVWVHFAPNFAEQWANLTRFGEIYAQTNSVQTGAPHAAASLLHRFVMVLSPAELLLVYGALGWLAWRGGRDERTLLALFAGTQVVTATLIGGSLGYQIMHAPLVAYAVARALTERAGLLVVAFVVLPAVVTPPARDMWAAVQGQSNTRMIAEVDLLSWRVPDGATVVGDEVFWLTLHPRTRFISSRGIAFYAHGNDIPTEQVLAHLDADMVICHTGYQQELCALADDYFDAPSEPFDITAGAYQVYSR